MSLKTIYIHVTRECNLHCRYCYCDAGEPYLDELTTQELEAVFQEAFSLEPEKIVVTGGEPLRRKDLIPLLQSIRPQRRSVRLGLVTNGSQVSMDNAPILCGLFDEIRISLDGPEALNDALRGPGAYKAAVRAFYYFQKSGCDPAASVTVVKENSAIMPNVLDHLAVLGFRRIHLNPVRSIGRALLSGTPSSKSSPLYEELKSLFGNQDPFWQYTTENRSECKVGDFPTVYANGNVYPCHVLAEPAFLAGNIRKESLSRICSKMEAGITIPRLSFMGCSSCEECRERMVTLVKENLHTHDTESHCARNPNQPEQGSANRI